MTLLPLALTFSLLALALAGFAVYRIEQRIRLVRRHLAKLDQEQQQMADVLEGVSAGNVDQGDQVVRLERDLRRLREHLTTLASRETGEGSFNQAIRMASRGTSREDIIQSCGLSEVEADLVLRIHQQQK